MLTKLAKHDRENLHSTRYIKFLNQTLVLTILGTPKTVQSDDKILQNFVSSSSVFRSHKTEKANNYRENWSSNLSSFFPTRLYEHDFPLLEQSI